MKLSQRTADQFTTLTQETQQLHQLNEEIQNDLAIFTTDYQKALEDGDLATIDHLYTQWDRHKDNFSNRFKNFNRYKQKSIIEMWQTFIDLPDLRLFSSAATTTLILGIICIIKGEYIPSIVFLVMSVILCRLNYQYLLKSRPYSIYSSHLTNEQYQILQEHTEAFTQAQMNIKHHTSLMTVKTGNILRKWQAFQQMQWDTEHRIHRDFEANTLAELRSAYVEHWVQNHR